MLCPRCLLLERALRPTRAQTLPRFPESDPLLQLSGVLVLHYRCAACGNIVALQDPLREIDPVRGRRRVAHWAHR